MGYRLPPSNLLRYIYRGEHGAPPKRRNLEMIVYIAPTLEASNVSVPMNAYLLTIAEQNAMRRHQSEINQVARYARIIGKQEVRIVGDDTPGEIHGGFRAVTFLHRGVTVTARTIFDVQYHYS
jgi:hypothetical protein